MDHQMDNENKELLAHLSGMFVRALPVRQGKAAEIDDLMALYAPSAWGVGLEGIEIKTGDCRLVAGCFGAELFLNEKRSGYPEHFRMCLTRCYGSCNYHSSESLAGPALQRAAVLSQVFIALANPRDKLAWTQARATARAAKANGAFVLLVAAQRFWHTDDGEVIEESIANTNPDDAHCLLRAEVEYPIIFLETFAWALMPALNRFARKDSADMAVIRQMLEQNHAAITHVRYSKKRCSLSKALSYGAEDCEQFGLDIKESAGIIVLLDNRDYPDLTSEQLVAEAKAALPGISPVHVVLNETSGAEPYPQSCSLNSNHDFLVIALFDPAVLQKKQASLSGN